MTRLLTRCGIVDLENLSAARFDLDRVAAWMATKNRFNGHLARPVSVAEHSLVVAGLVPCRLRLAALLHDAHEYVIGDVLRPVESALTETVAAAEALARMRARVDMAMAVAVLGEDFAAVYRLHTAMVAPEVVAADDAACAWELRYCAMALTDWPERALYPRAPESPERLATRWRREVEEAAANWIAAGGLSPAPHEALVAPRPGPLPAERGEGEDAAPGGDMGDAP